MRSDSNEILELAEGGFLRAVDAKESVGIPEGDFVVPPAEVSIGEGRDRVWIAVGEDDVSVGDTDIDAQRQLIALSRPMGPLAGRQVEDSVGGGGVERGVPNDDARLSRLIGELEVLAGS